MDSSTTTTVASAGRREQASAELRARLVEAALVEFANHGFEGASTRAIAQRAGAHQPQINYHFASKDELWKAVLLQLLAELDAEIRIEPDTEPRAAMEIVIRALVTIAARRPELNRIMIQEGTAPSGRLDWLVETQVARRAGQLRALWEQLVAEGSAAPVPTDLVYHVVVGASSLLHANAPEARLLGVEPTDPAVVEAHADAMVARVRPWPPTPQGTTPEKRSTR